MTAHRLWFERTFELDLPDERFPELLDRLRAAPDCVETIVRGLPPDVLARREDGRWSILETIGHLGDLEALFDGRLDDFAAGRAALRPADLENRATHEAGHQTRPVEALVERFRGARGAIVERITSLPPTVLARSAMHPRLGQPMRVVDMMLFQAEHDDHHLEHIRELVALPGGVNA